MKPNKLIFSQEEDEDEERTKYDEIGKLKIVNMLPLMIVDQVCEKFIESKIFGS